MSVALVGLLTFAILLALSLTAVCLFHTWPWTWWDVGNAIGWIGVAAGTSSAFAAWAECKAQEDA